MFYGTRGRSLLFSYESPLWGGEEKKIASRKKKVDPRVKTFGQKIKINFFAKIVDPGIKKKVDPRVNFFEQKIAQNF